MVGNTYKIRVRGVGLRNVLKTKSIRTKIIGGFSIVLLLIISLGIYNFFILQHTNERAEGIMDEELPLLMADSQLESSLANRIGAIRGYLLSGDEFYKDLFQEYTEDTIYYEDFIKDLGYQDAYEDLFAQEQEWRAFIETDVFVIYDRGNESLALRNLLDANDQFTAMITSYQENSAHREQFILEQEKDTISSGETTIFIVLIATVAVVIIGIVLALVTANNISKPLKVVRNRMKEMAQGDLSHDLLETTSADEIGQLITSTNEMHQNTRELLHEIVDVSTTVSTHSDELTQSASEVSAGADSVAKTMGELASGTESQASQTNDISSVISTSTSLVHETNESGRYIEQSSYNVLEMTSDGSELMKSSTEQMGTIDQIVNDAVRKVEGLDGHAQKISDLIAVIQDIAEQTNLLALNAAIEAARAGEHGKGFAVVADEVRKLAEQVSDSVTDITETVENIQSESTFVTESLQVGYQEVEQGTNQIRETEETFVSIHDAVTEMAESISQIASNLTEIANGSEETASSIQDIAAISEETAAGVEETSAHTEEATSAMDNISSHAKQQKELADELNRLVLQFKL